MTALRRGYDAYSPPSSDQAKAAGFAFGFHYLGGSPDKDLTTAERVSNLAAGIDLGLNWEGDTSDADHGYQVGVNYGTWANQQADADGAPTKNFDGSLVGIYYSVDASRTAGQVRPYFQGIASVRGRAAGGYGGTEMLAMLDEGLIRWWWMANAGSWSGYNTQFFPTHPRAAFRQYVGGSPAGMSVDVDDQMLADAGLWLSRQTTNPTVVLPVAPPVIPYKKRQAQTCILSPTGSPSPVSPPNGPGRIARTPKTSMTS